MMPRYPDQITLDEERNTARHELFTKLVAIARELLELDAPRVHVEEDAQLGVTFYDVRVKAEAAGILNGEEKQPVLSFGSSVMERAGGIGHGWRRTKHDKSHRRLLRTYRLASAAAAQRTA